jgi:hypothetical protein
VNLVKQRQLHALASPAPQQVSILDLHLVIAPHLHSRQQHPQMNRLTSERRFYLLLLELLNLCLGVVF